MIYQEGIGINSGQINPFKVKSPLLSCFRGAFSNLSTTKDVIFSDYARMIDNFLVQQ